MYDKTILGEKVSSIHDSGNFTVVGISEDITGCRRFLCRPHNKPSADEISLYAGEIEMKAYESGVVDVESTNTELETDIECGYTVRDQLSGFTGTVSTVVFRLFNGVRICVTQYDECDNSNPSSMWFDGSRAEILDTEKPDYDVPNLDDDESGYIHGCAVSMTDDVEME